MSPSLILLHIRVDPDIRVFDLEGDTGMAAFKVCWQEGMNDLCNLSGLGINDIFRKTKVHGFNAQITKL